MGDDPNVSESETGDFQSGVEIWPTPDPSSISQDQIQSSSDVQQSDETSVALVEKMENLLLLQQEQNKLLTDQNGLLIFLIGLVAGVTFMTHMLKGWYRA
jgi:hypothetical protein